MMHGKKNIKFHLICISMSVCSVTKLICLTKETMVDSFQNQDICLFSKASTPPI